jgi:hypothetical protein
VYVGRGDGATGFVLGTGNAMRREDGNFGGGDGMRRQVFLLAVEQRARQGAGRKMFFLGIKQSLEREHGQTRPKHMPSY